MSSHPIAEKLVRRMKRERDGKVVNLKNVIAGRPPQKSYSRPWSAKSALPASIPRTPPMSTPKTKCR